MGSMTGSMTGLMKAFALKRIGWLGLLAGIILLSACGPGKYGYSRYYEPLREEKSYYQSAREYTHANVVARPQDFNGQLISWFGIVKSINAQDDGTHRLTLSFHKHRDRHLCEGDVKSSCRVTVNDRSTGEFIVYARINPKHLVPSVDKLQPNSLMRIYGKVRCRQVNSEYELDKWECDKDKDGNLLIIGEYYRHWPRRQYRTTNTMDKMVR